MAYVQVAYVQVAYVQVAHVQVADVQVARGICIRSRDRALQGAVNKRISKGSNTFRSALRREGKDGAASRRSVGRMQMDAMAAVESGMTRIQGGGGQAAPGARQGPTSVQAHANAPKPRSHPRNSSRGTKPRIRLDDEGSRLSRGFDPRAVQHQGQPPKSAPDRPSDLFPATIRT